MTPPAVHCTVAAVGDPSSDALELVEGKVAFAVVKGRLKMAHVDDIGTSDEEPADAADIAEEAVLLNQHSEDGDGRDWADDDDAPLRNAHDDEPASSAGE